MMAFVRRIRVLAVVAAAACGLVAAGARPVASGPFDGLTPGQWRELPNTKIRGVLPNPLPDRKSVV